MIDKEKIELGHHDPLDYLPITKEGGFKPSTAAMQRLPTHDNPEKNKIFQIDPDTYHDYIESKKLGRKERIDKYLQNLDIVYPEIYKFICDTLAEEYPDYFETGSYQTGHYTDPEIIHLKNKLTGDFISFSRMNGDLVECGNRDYRDVFDALAMQVPEDLVIHELYPKGDRASEISLFHANGWNAEWAIGKDFRWVHKDVPNIDKLIPHPDKLVAGIISSGKTVERVGAISFRRNTKLNRHPSDTKPTDFGFDKENPELYMRFERQTVTGFREQKAMLFTIKTYFVDCDQRGKNKETHDKILNAFKQNSSKLYSKWFFDEYRDDVLTWLEGEK